MVDSKHGNSSFFTWKETELTLVYNNMKIMSLVNKAKLAFQLSVSGLLAYCSSFTSAPFCSTGSELRYWLGAHPVWGHPDNFAGNTA